MHQQFRCFFFLSSSFAFLYHSASMRFATLMDGSLGNGARRSMRMRSLY